MVREPDPKLIELLSAYDPLIGELALALRKMVLAEAPHVAAYTNYINLGRGGSFPILTVSSEEPEPGAATYASPIAPL